MALTELEVRRLNSFVTSLRADAWSPGPADAMFRGLSNNLGTGLDHFYYARLDRFYGRDAGDNNTESLWWDPLAIDPSGPASGYINGSDQKTIFAVGEWDKINARQRIYGAINTGDNNLTELNSEGSAPDIQDKTTWPFHTAASGIEASTGIGSGTNGSRISGQGAMVLFESAGFALQPNVTVREGGVSYDRVLAKIDLTTGLSTIMDNEAAGFKVAFQDTPHIHQEPPIFGSSFCFSNIQFVPDDDSVPATPKGRLFFSTNDSDDNLRFTGLLGPGSQSYCYVMFVEFNPSGIAASPGNPNRVHGRRTLFSRMIFTEETEPESGGIGTTTNGDKGFSYPVWFHPPTNQILVWINDSPPFDNDIVLIRHSLAPILNVVSNPTNINEIETNKTVIFEVQASGDIGEPIENQDITWDLERASTRRESLDTVGAPATSTVNNIPIDSGTLVVERDPGTGPVVLTEGVDYSVVLSTGVITWLGSHPNLDLGYTATYEHKTNPVPGPFGALQTTLSRTDSNGIAQARVVYEDDDDIVGQKDAISGDPS